MINSRRKSHLPGGFSCHEPDLQGMFTKGWCNENNITGYSALRPVPGRIGERGRETLTPQQQRMTTCNQQATSQSLKGDARKTYMSDCLKNGASKPAEKA